MPASLKHYKLCYSYDQRNMKLKAPTLLLRSNCCESDLSTAACDILLSSVSSVPCTFASSETSTSTSTDIRDVTTSGFLKLTICDCSLKIYSSKQPREGNGKTENPKVCVNPPPKKKKNPVAFLPDCDRPENALCS